MKHYAKKRGSVQAVQWLGVMTPDVRALIGSREAIIDEEADHRTTVVLPRTLVLGNGWYARVGDWILLSSGADVVVIGDSVFRFVYEEVDAGGHAVLSIRDEREAVGPVVWSLTGTFEIARTCVGCGAKLVYACDAAPGDGEPHFEPIEHDTARFGHGHLCPPCTSAVKGFLGKRREQRIANYEAVARGHK